MTRAATTALQGAVDFTRSVPPVVPEVDRHLRRTLRQLSGSGENLGLAMREVATGGTAADREAGVALLAPRLGDGIDPARVVVANGTQNLVLLLLSGLVGPGNLLLCEALTYSVLARLAAQAGVRIAGVAIDAEGVRPDAFAAACRALSPRALFCNPTVHNPTTAIMSAARRREIADIARRHGVAVIEDDVLGLIHPEAPAPIAAAGPEVTWYLMGLTKCLAHGMRVAYLVAPDAARAQAFVDRARTMSTWAPAPLSSAIVRRWIADGTAEAISRAIRREAEARQTLAARALAAADAASQPGALHLWLRLPPRWPRAAFSAAARDRDVLVRPADLFAVDGAAAPEAVRLSLSSPLTQIDVERGLEVVAQLLADVQSATHLP